MSESDHCFLPQPGDALLVVDVQNDFLPGGTLGIDQADRILPPLNQAITLFEKTHQLIIFSRDWHPENHCSFSEYAGPWPRHCVANTHGAAFSRQINWPTQAFIVSKARAAQEDAYSAFQGTHLAEQLQQFNITRLLICGLATDYCVLQTTLDALKHGFSCYLLTDAMAAVNVRETDGKQALEKMLESGAILISSDQLL
ncbi:isochorismatase family protein [Celerinatantimonas sp. YJH-8]|uniref:isochorismatase family protein n=1 Tax=Celerinatantimonas sp. YJH-8 TaxID=3228714 RepID=UPI0038C0648E